MQPIELDNTKWSEIKDAEILYHASGRFIVMKSIHENRWIAIDYKENLILTANTKSGAQLKVQFTLTAEGSH